MGTTCSRSMQAIGVVVSQPEGKALVLGVAATDRA